MKPHLTEQKTRHARGQLAARYGVETTLEQFAQLNSRIRKNHKYPGTAALIVRQGQDREWWRVKWRGVEVIAVWDTAQQTIVTFLKPSCLHNAVIGIRDGLAAVKYAGNGRHEAVRSE